MNSTFVNVTLSADKMINGKFSLSDLKNSSQGWWIMKPEVAEKIKYVFPVRKNEILGVFEVIDFEYGPDHKGNVRVNFNLKMIFEGSTMLLESAKRELTRTHYVVKQFEV